MPAGLLFVASRPMSSLLVCFLLCFFPCILEIWKAIILALIFMIFLGLVISRPRTFRIYFSICFSVYYFASLTRMIGGRGVMGLCPYLPLFTFPSALLLSPWSSLSEESVIVASFTTSLTPTVHFPSAWTCSCSLDLGWLKAIVSQEESSRDSFWDWFYGDTFQPLTFTHW